MSIEITHIAADFVQHMRANWSRCSTKTIRKTHAKVLQDLQAAADAAFAKAAKREEAQGHVEDPEAEAPTEPAKSAEAPATGASTGAA